MKSVKNPLVSVIVPSYNHSKYIEECVESIVNQTYSNYELIVIDDGSTDNSVEILERLQNKYNFQLVVQENIGLTKTLNKALSLSSGKYISIIASDDYWKTEKIKYQIECLENNLEVKLCFTDVIYVDGNSKMIDRRSYQERGVKLLQTFEDVLLNAKLPPASLMFKRSDLEKIGGFDETLKVEDLDLWLNILKEGGYAKIIPEKLAFYRDYEGNTHKNKVIDLVEDHIVTIKKYCEYSTLRKKAILNEWYIRSGYTLINYNNKKAIEYLRKGIGKFWDIRIYKSIIKLFLPVNIKNKS